MADVDSISATALVIADRASQELVESEFYHDSAWTFYAPLSLLDDPVIKEAVEYLCARKIAERADSETLVTLYLDPEQS